MSNIVKYESNGALIEVSESIIRDKFGKDITPLEAQKILAVCQMHKLHPFLDIHVIKYGGSAQIITAYQAFLRRADEHPQYDSFETTTEDRDGKLYSATTVVYRKDRQPLKWTVYAEEYLDSSKPTHKRMPRFMLSKISLATALRMAFPNVYEGLYIAEEFEKPEKPQVTAEDPKLILYKLLKKEYKTDKAVKDFIAQFGYTETMTEEQAEKFLEAYQSASAIPGLPDDEFIATIERRLGL